MQHPPPRLRSRTTTACWPAIARASTISTRRWSAYKATATLPPADPAREKEQIARLRRLAEESDLDPEFSEKFIRFVIEEVIRHHEKARNRGPSENSATLAP